MQQSGSLDPSAPTWSRWVTDGQRAPGVEEAVGRLLMKENPCWGEGVAEIERRSLPFQRVLKNAMNYIVHPSLSKHVAGIWMLSFRGMRSLRHMCDILMQ